MNLNDSLAPKRFVARTLFDGTGGPAQKDVLIETVNGRFSSVAPCGRGQVSGSVEEYDVVSAGLIDIQINGANDVQFNDAPTASAIEKIADGAAKGGTAWILPTYITDFGHNYQNAMSAARRAIDDNALGVLGVHLEGPFLSPKRPGIHPAAAIRQITHEDLSNLTADFPGCLLVTLAPEEQPSGAIGQLVDAGVTVFVGHSEAGFAELERARSQGLSGSTHLFNAMSQITGREPGVSGTVLNVPSYFAGIIADGHHVHWNNLAMAVQLMPERLCLVTDAMCTLAGTLSKFELYGETIHLDNGRLSNDNGTLAGAHIAMDQSIQNLIDQGIASPELAFRMASRNPAEALGMHNDIGTVQTGFVASASFFDADYNAVGVLRQSKMSLGQSNGARKYQRQA